MIDPQAAMERARQVAQLWDWLPAFRAVAETQHLPTAALAMRVSPSALSRAVRLLEDAVGHPLFDRPGRRISLNDRGERLLEAVRDAMRGVHSALEFIDDVLYEGPVQVSAPLHWLRLLVPPTVHRLATRHPGLVVSTVALNASAVPVALRQGSIDVALVDMAVPTEQLACELLSEFSLDIYASNRHPLANRPKLSWADVTRSEYIAIAHYGAGVWQLRNMTPRVHVEDPATGALLCEHRCAITALPRVFGASLPLVRLPLPLRATIPLYLLHRPTLTIPGRTEAVAEALRTSLQDSDAEAV